MKGEGNQQDYGMRIYDPRVGKFLSVDPLTPKYPWYTPYQFAGNKPIQFIDLDGLEEAPPSSPYKERESAKDYQVYVSSDPANESMFKGELWPAKYEYYDGQWTYTRETTAGSSYYWMDGNKQWNSYVPDFEAHTLSAYNFVAEGSGKLSFGGQIGFKGTFKGVGLSGEVNMGSVELGSLGWNYHDVNGSKFKYNYLLKDNMASFTRGGNLSVSIKALEMFGVSPSVGPFLEDKFQVSLYGTTYHNDKDLNMGIGAGYAVLGNKSAEDLGKMGYGSKAFALNPIPKVQPKPNAGTRFFGLDIGLGAKVILGAEVKFKIGIAY